MNKLILSFAIILTAVSLTFSQTPYAFKFQGLARDLNGQPMVEQNLQLRLTILSDDPVAGDVVYEETHELETSPHGLFSLHVGKGSSPQFLDEVDWAGHTHYLSVELKRPQDPDYLFMGTHQLLSVPYALHAASADEVDDADADSLNEIQHLQKKAFGNTLGFPDSVQVVLSKSTDTFTLMDVNPANELQELEVGSITIVPTTFDMAEIGLKLSQSGAPEIMVDAAWGNEFQNVEIQPAAWPNSWVQLWNPDGKKHNQALITDTDPANELQDLDLVIIQQPWGGVEHKLELREKTSSAPTWNVTKNILLPDSDPTNELQTLKIDTPPANPWASELSLLHRIVVTPPGGSPMVQWVPFMNPALINDTDPANELQELDILTIKDLITGGVTSDLLLKNKALTPEGAITYQTQAVSLPDPDPENELQRLELKEEFDGDCGPYFDLQLLRQIKDSTGFVKWIVYDSLPLPDGDPANELQRFRFEEEWYTANGRSSILYLERPECDSAGNITWVEDSYAWIDDTDWHNELQTLEKIGSTIELQSLDEIFNSTVVLNDDDPKNELQELFFFPDLSLLSIFGGNEVDLSSLESPWLENPSGTKVSYPETAVATRFETPEEGVVIDDTGISRFDPLTGFNVSNICLEEAGNTVFGRFEVLNNGITVAELRSCSHQSAILDGLGPNGFYNTLLSHLSGNPNHGLMGVVDALNVMRAGSLIDENGLGVIFGDIKNFRMPHPGRAGKEIWYASLEGPEAAAYERGVGQLVDGEAFIKLSEHFLAVVNTSTMTVNLTPHSADTYGLAVVEKTATGFHVREMAKGSGSFGFDWEVKCVRKGFEDYKPVRDEKVLFEDRNH